MCRTSTGHPSTPEEMVYDEKASHASMSGLLAVHDRRMRFWSNNVYAAKAKQKVPASLHC